MTAYAIKRLVWMTGCKGEQVSYVFGNYYEVRRSELTGRFRMRYIIRVPGFEHQVVSMEVEDMEHGRSKAQAHYEGMLCQQLIECIEQ